jgi:hypothetical protein
MKKSKSLPKKMQVMCVNNKCTAWLSPTDVPLDKISYYKCPRCKSSMRKHSIKVADKLRSKENKKNEKLLSSNPQKNNNTNLQNNSENNDKYAPLAVIPILIFLHWKNPDWETTKFFKAYGFNIFTGLILTALIISIFYFIFQFFKKKASNVDFKSFRSLDSYYMSGNSIRFIKQTILTLPFYYYIKFKSDEDYLAFMNIGSVMREADISYWIFIIPFLICYFFVKLEFSNTEFDLNNKYVDKNVGVSANAFAFGMFYGLSGWIGAALLDAMLVILYILKIIIGDL